MFGLIGDELATTDFDRFTINCKYIISLNPANMISINIKAYMAT